MDRKEKRRLDDLLQAAAAGLDVGALGRGDRAAFSHSVDALRPQWKPVGEYAKRFTLYFDANAHIDAAWLWRDKETIEVCKNTFASVLHMMDVRPDFTYTQSAAAYYDWMERLYPDLFGQMQKRVKDGRWEIVGGMWVEPDCNLPDGVSWARHLLYAKRYFQKKFGVDVKIGWNPDSFGYNWNMPMFYADAGIDAFITQKIGWNERNVFPYRLFWWEGSDGSKVLSYFPFDYVNTIDDPYQLVDWSRQFEANTGLTKMMILFGVGDHGGGPSLEMISRIERLKSLDIYPSIEYGNTATYLDWVKQHDLTALPVWDDELYLEYHQGTYTTQAAMKKFNRECEVLLTNAEKFGTLADLYGGRYGSAGLESAWRDVLFNQFHDILPGSGIRENYLDATEKYAQAGAIGRRELQGALQTLSGRANTAWARRGDPLVVHNSLNWRRTDLVTVDLPESEGGDWSVFDDKGLQIPSQMIGDRVSGARLLFLATDVPPLGYRCYELRMPVTAAARATKHAAAARVENAMFAVAVDTASGLVTSIRDKKNGREVLGAPGNDLQILEDKPNAWDAWNIGLTGVRYPSTLRSVELVESGPVRTVLRITRDFLRPGVKKDFPTEDFPTSFFTQDIILTSGLDRIDFVASADWWEEKTMLKVAFPVAVRDTMATYEIPFGSIRRSTQWRDSWDSAKVEVPAVRWADLSQDDYGVALLNASKYGYDIKGNVMRLSLLRSPKWPDPTADRGKHVIPYALWPHAGRVDAAEATRKGMEYNNPLLAVFTDRHKGTLPPQHAFLTLEPSNLILTTLKKAEEEDAWIVQWYEAAGKATEATLTLPAKVSRVVRSNLLEASGTPIPATGTRVSVPTKKRALVTLKIYF
jgi:alpha-mannosidase